MAVSRYQKDTIVSVPQRRFMSASAVLRIRQAMSRGQIAFRVYVTTEGQRLDQLAGQLYGDGRYWWILAATSNIGWGLQVPAGTRIVVPIDINSVMGFV